MDEQKKAESIVEEVLVHVVAEIQELQSTLRDSATDSGDATARWVADRLDKVLTVPLADGREVYLGVKTSEPEDYGTL
jgi:hypothetical protein